MKPKKSLAVIVVPIVALCVFLFGLAYVADSSETMTRMWLESTHTRSK